MAIGTDAKYGAVQQLGAKRSDYPHLWGDIPARPYLGLSEEDREEALETLARHLSPPST